MRTVSNIAIVTAMAVAAMWAADVITRPPQRPVPTSLEGAPSAEMKATERACSVAERPLGTELVAGGGWPGSGSMPVRRPSSTTATQPQR